MTRMIISGQIKNLKFGTKVCNFVDCTLKLSPKIKKKLSKKGSYDQAFTEHNRKMAHQFNLSKNNNEVKIMQ